MSSNPVMADARTGLTEADVRERTAAGSTNAAATAHTTRSIKDILVANTLNSVNIVLLVLGTALVAMGRTRDGVINLSFIIAIVAIGSFQEIRAKRRLDRIAILSTPTVTVRRDGRDVHISPAGVVLDDIVVVGPGEQIVADGMLIEGGPVTMNESLLTGESEPVAKRIGDELHSGTFCISGTASALTTRVGNDSLATSLTAAAQGSTAAKTPLQRLVDDVLRVLITAAAFFGLLFVAQGIVSETSAVRVVETATVTAAIVPVGLFLIFVVTYSMSAARLTRHDLLVQQLNALESISHVDVVCSDKTGTLTANRLQLAAMEPVGEQTGSGQAAGQAADDGRSREAVAEVLGTFANSVTSANATTGALRAAFPGRIEALADEVPFESANRWSAASFGGASYVLGAPEALEPHMPAGFEGRDTIDQWTAAGHRVLLFAAGHGTDALHDHEGRPALPPLEPLALVGFADELRDDARETVSGLLDDGVALKIISGDSPDTVAALARQVGLPEDLAVVSGPELDELDESEFAAAARRADVFGRIAPHQKERLVTALRDGGSYVAMIGDGVNDTLALTAADVGIAMESGSSAARGTADLVLLNDSFAAVRPAITEGRRIVSGMRDILRLTVARSATLGMVAVAMMIVNQVFPFSAGAQTIYGLITITIPTVGLALWARPERARTVDAAELTRFVMPVALVNLFYGGTVFVATYYITRHGLQLFDGRFDSIVGFALGADQASAPEVAAILGRTTLVVFLILTGLLTILFLQPPIRFFTAPGQPLHADWRPAALVVASVALLVAIMTTGLRSWLELAQIPGWGYAALAAAVVAWTLTLRAVLRRTVPLISHWRRTPHDHPTPT